MSGERPVTHEAAREETCGAFRIYDEGLHVARLCRWCNIGHVVARPFCAIPPDQFAGLVPRLAAHVRGRAVVQDAAIGRPRECPFGEGARVVRIAVVAAGHLVARFGVASGVDPAARSSRAVVAKRGESRNLLAFLKEHFCRIVRIRHVGNDVTVDLFRDLVRRRILGILVGPNELGNRLGSRAAFFLVQRLQPQIDLRHDPDVAFRLARRCAAGPVPLQPPAGIDERACIFGKAGRWQLDHLGADLRRIDVVELAVVLPEPRSLRLQRIHDDEELELRQRRRHFRAVRERQQRVEALAECNRSSCPGASYRTRAARRRPARRAWADSRMPQLFSAVAALPHIDFWKLTKNFL